MLKKKEINYENKIFMIFKVLEDILLKHNIKNKDMQLYWDFLLKAEECNYYLDYKYDYKITYMLEKGKQKEKEVNSDE